MRLGGPGAGCAPAPGGCAHQASNLLNPLAEGFVGLITGAGPVRSQPSAVSRTSSPSAPGGLNPWVPSDQPRLSCRSRRRSIKLWLEGPVVTTEGAPSQGMLGF